MKDMRGILQMLKEHKIVVAVLAALIVLFVVWSVWQYGNRQAEIISQQEQQAALEDSEDSGEGVAEEETDASPAELTDRQKDIISGYTVEQKEFVAFLSASVWTDSSETSSIRFTEDSFTEVRGNEKRTVPFAIPVVIVDDITGEGSTYKSYVAAIETDNATYIMHVRRWVTSNGKTGEWKITSGAFSSTGEYVRKKASEKVEVIGLTDEVKEFYGGEDAIVEAITEYVSLTYPTASTATWQEKTEIDDRNKVITTTFVLDTKSSAQITVVYRMDTEEIEVS